MECVRDQKSVSSSSCISLTVLPAQQQALHADSTLQTIHTLSLKHASSATHVSHYAASATHISHLASGNNPPNA